MFLFSFFDFINALKSSHVQKFKKMQIELQMLLNYFIKIESQSLNTGEVFFLRNVISIMLNIFIYIYIYIYS